MYPSEVKKKILNFSSAMRKVRRGGGTGITAAMILIAFVLIASIFSVILLNLGFYSSQRLDNVVKENAREAGTLIQMVGGVQVETQDPAQKNQYAQHITFALRPIRGSEDIPFSAETTTIGIYVSSYDRSQPALSLRNIFLNDPAVLYSEQVTGTITRITPPTTLPDEVMEEGEVFLVRVTIAPEGSTPIQLDPFDEFSITINFGQGPDFTIERSMPANIEGTVDLG